MPSEPKEVSSNPLEYTLLLYGREKIGKTTWLSSFPDSIFLTFEPGSKGLSIFEYNAGGGGCKTWDIARRAVELLEGTDRFKTVIIDTADRAYDVCLDWVCKQLGIDHPGEDLEGKKDYGKSWKEVRKEFTNLVHRIIQTGRGLAFTSHLKEETFRSRSGDEFTRIHPSMSGQARGVIESLVDLFFYCEYMRDTEGKTHRVIITEGDEVVWAGHREIPTAPSFPRLIPMTKKDGWDIYRAAFMGEDVGLDPKTLLPSRAASQAVQSFYRKVRQDGEAKPAKKIPTKIK